MAKMDETEQHQATRTTIGPSVYFEKSVTKNMGDFNSAKVTVGITLPIDFTRDDLAKVRKTIETADKIVTSELESQVDELIA